MERYLTAEISVIISAARRETWQALTKLEILNNNLEFTALHTNWQPGAPIQFIGNFNGRPFDATGLVLAYAENEMLEFTLPGIWEHFADNLQNGATITCRIGGEDGGVTITVIIDNIPTLVLREQWVGIWTLLLKQLKHMLEANKPLSSGRVML